LLASIARFRLTGTLSRIPLLDRRERLIIERLRPPHMIGQTIGHCKILEQLGAGGMGVVYKALDTHLDRFVAIKVLPLERVADPERKRRFVLEAKAASALNHPNIITIYDIASENGVDFISMEYVPGKPLNQVIPRKGLALSEALKYAVQIADALAAAHAVGIVHRDLKPGNVMVSGVEEQGRPRLIKVLDFGLAKLAKTAEKNDLECTKTLGNDEGPSTEEGIVLGTVSYLSPEQAEGKRVDVRSDIFSFGALLYEMVTGRKAFGVDSKLFTLSAILREEPTPAGQLVEGLPQELERIIARCLRKSPDRRFQTAADLRIALEELKEESDSGRLKAVSAPLRRQDRRLAWAGALLAIMLVVGVIWFVRSVGAPSTPTLTALPLTTYPGFQTSPSFSPDGNQVAFAWDGEKRDNFDIYVKLIGTAAPPLRITTHVARDYSPAWSTDGRFIAFLRTLSPQRAAVLVVSALGGPEQKIGEIASSDSPDFANLALAWSSDGDSLVMSDRDSAKEPFALFALSIESGERRRLTGPPVPSKGDSAPAFSPDGRTLAFTRYNSSGIGDVFALGLSDGLRPVGEPTQLTFNSRAMTSAWTASGRELVFSSAKSDQPGLWRIAMPRRMGQPSKPQRLGSLSEAADEPTISPVGRRLVYARVNFDANIWRIAGPTGGSGPDRNAGLGSANAGVPLVSSTRNDTAPQYSSDGKRIAFMSVRSGSPEIWVCDNEGSNAVPITFFRGPSVTNPRWSPDGTRIAFDSDAMGEFDVWVVAASGGKPQRMTTHPANDGNPSWTRDGQWIYFDSARTGEQQLWKIPWKGGDPIQITRDGGWAPLESPDGKFLYYVKRLAATSLWRVPVEGGQPTKVLDGLSYSLNLAIVDTGLYFVPERDAAASSTIQFLNFATNQVRTVANFDKPLNMGLEGGLAVSPNRRWLLYTQFDQPGSELMLVENFQ
jgi:Tol biopolymer transport system component